LAAHSLSKECARAPRQLYFELDSDHVGIIRALNSRPPRPLPIFDVAHPITHNDTPLVRSSSVDSAKQDLETLGNTHQHKMSSDAHLEQHGSSAPVIEAHSSSTAAIEVHGSSAATKEAHGSSATVIKMPDSSVLLDSKMGPCEVHSGHATLSASGDGGLKTSRLLPPLVFRGCGPILESSEVDLCAPPLMSSQLSAVLYKGTRGAYLAERTAILLSQHDMDVLSSGLPPPPSIGSVHDSVVMIQKPWKIPVAAAAEIQL
jgi:hypothetical protein